MATKASLFGDDPMETSSTFLLSKVDPDAVFASAPSRLTVDSRSKSDLDKRVTPKTSPRYSVKERQKVTSETEDPLSEKMLNSYDPVLFKRNENLSIRKEDEARIVAGLHSAAKKQSTGSIYSVVVDLSKTGTLGIGVKDLADHVLAVSMLKRENCSPGAGEDAGKQNTAMS